MSTNSGKVIAQKQLAQRELLWPQAEQHLWNRKAYKGFATIPKTMPILLQAMDELSNGKPLSQTYLGLWCETWDNSMLSAAKKSELAFGAGFRGQRAEYSWLSRVKILHSLHFIDIKPGKSGDVSHILLWNPHKVIRWHKDNKTSGLTEGTYNALVEKALEIGANDMIPVIIPST